MPHLRPSPLSQPPGSHNSRTVHQLPYSGTAAAACTHMVRARGGLLLGSGCVWQLWLHACEHTQKGGNAVRLVHAVVGLAAACGCGGRVCGCVRAAAKARKAGAGGGTVRVQAALGKGRGGQQGERLQDDAAPTPRVQASRVPPSSIHRIVSQTGVESQRAGRLLLLPFAKHTTSPGRLRQGHTPSRHSVLPLSCLCPHTQNSPCEQQQQQQQRQPSTLPFILGHFFGPPPPFAPFAWPRSPARLAPAFEGRAVAALTSLSAAAAGSCC